MAISIQIPNLPENLTQIQLFERLVDLRSHFEIYALSFFIIGIYWIAYHQILGHIARSHGTMIWLNLCFLFFITLISFAVDLQVDYGYFPMVFSIYALVLIFAGSLLAIIWLHAKKNELIEATLSPSAIQNVTLQSILTPTVFSISILISLINVQIAYYFWLVIIPAKIVINKKYPY
jgi:TMEM175 potassium channel family protein